LLTENAQDGVFVDWHLTLSKRCRPSPVCNQAARFISRQLRQEHLKSGSSGISTWPHFSQMNHSGRRNLARSDRPACNRDNIRSALSSGRFLSGALPNTFVKPNATCERCASLAATLVRQNPQFEHGHVGEVHGVILSLPHCPRRAKIPLLANNFLEGAPVIRRPSQDELLCALDFAFLEN
jgi:hypothetical protein